MYRSINPGWMGNSSPWAGAPMAGGWIGLVIGGIAIIALVIGIIALVRSTRSRSSDTRSRDDGLTILTERFARGDIDADTFRSMKAEL